MTTIRALWSLLDTRQRIITWLLLAMMVITMVLELCGLGLVMPALSVMANQSGTTSPILASIVERLGNPSKQTLLLLGLGLLLVVYTVKTIVLFAYTYCQARFIASLQSSLSGRLFAIYMSQPWSFHLERNSSALVRNVYEIQTIGNLLLAVMGVVAECIILVGVVGFLIWAEPVGTLVIAAVIGGSTVLFLKATARRTQRWGEVRYAHFGQLQRHLQQGLGGVKEARIRNAEKHFIDRFNLHSRIVSRMAALQAAAQTVPRMWLELVAIAAVCLLSATLVFVGRSPDTIVPSLALFAAAAFRILPAANRLSVGLQAIRFSKKPIDVLAREFTFRGEPAATPVTPIAFRDEVVIQDVTFSFPAAPAPALDKVTLRFRHGQSVGVIGGSGAGKSTMVDILLGLLEPRSGNVTVDGVDIRDNLRGWQRLVGYVPQTIYLCDDSLRENIAFGIPPDQIDEKAIRRALVAARLDEFVDGLPAGVDTVVGERGVRLSGGQRQRIGIARALYHDPEVLVLDEATSALDTDTESEVMAAVNALHGAKTIIIVAHRLSTVEDCDMLYRLERGKVVRSGSFAEVVGS